MDKKLTCSLELGQRIAELGVTVGSYFLWLVDPIRGARVTTYDVNNANEVYPAYTVGELCRMFPDCTSLCLSQGKWWVDGQDSIETASCADTPEDACAEFVIAALECGDLTVETINKKDK